MFKDLVAQKLVVEKRQGDLRVLKFQKRVFFKNLWDLDPLLIEARGIVLDDDDQIVQMPFKKIWNHFERGIKIDRDRKVQAIRKVNGFLAVATLHKGSLLVSTTGSTQGPYVEMARKWVDKPGIRRMLEANPTHSFMFEVVDPDDQILHPIQEESGAYLIGAREKKIGAPLESEETLDTISDLGELDGELKRPDVMVAGFGKMQELAKTAKFEGWIVRDAQTGIVLCKLKSNFYLMKKALMRTNRATAGRWWKNPGAARQELGEIFYPLLEKISADFTSETWADLSNAEKFERMSHYGK